MPTEWTDEDQAEFKRRIRERLPIACACDGKGPGELLCPCDKVRAEVRAQIVSEKSGE